MPHSCGSMSDIQPLLSADGPQDLMDQLNALSMLGSKNTIALADLMAEVITRAAKAADDAKLNAKATNKLFAAKKAR